MAKPSESVTLYGDKAELFREIKAEMADRKGFEPGNAETLAELMADWHQQNRR
ncbi:hypothetical protein [Halobacterium rubrum]|jgi:hypothetical protein|uniref:hypothetical protein n=1 Tax=Halobacterium TaxID=2239 RepID=UPI001F3F52F1|nr:MULTISPECIES: hypothetical protein [Halobacterium]MDH5019037.1 hypothetical protein [Halobacterium rubrum]